MLSRNIELGFNKNKMLNLKDFSVSSKDLSKMTKYFVFEIMLGRLKLYYIFNIMFILHFSFTFLDM